MKGKIFVALKTKYKNLGFRDEAFNGVADYLSKTVEDEKDIETAICGVESLLKSFQGEVDFVRNEKTGLQKKLEDLEKEIKEKQDGKEKKTDVNLEGKLEDKINSLLSPLLDKLSHFETERNQEKRKSEILSKIKDYGIPDFYAKKYVEKNSIGEIDAEAYLSEMKGSFEDIKQEFANNGFVESKKPQDGEHKQVSEEDELISQINEKTKQIVEQKKD